MSYQKKQYRNGSLRGPLDSQGKLIKSGKPTFTATNKNRVKFSGVKTKES